jgi:hypothetical protein
MSGDHAQQDRTDPADDSDVTLERDGVAKVAGLNAPTKQSAVTTSPR